MLSAPVLLAEKYDYLADRFRVGYAFLRRADLAELPVGAIELENGIVAQIQEYTTIPPEEGKYETHDRFFDIQYMVSGQEKFGVAPREGLVVDTPYDAGRDITFYQDPALDGVVLLRAGDLIVVAPEDAHKPRLVAGEACAVKKVVVKIPVDDQ